VAVATAAAAAAAACVATTCNGAAIDYISADVAATRV
jgi:hypothetical protein